MPKISVLMAAFNAGKYIDAAIESLIAQSLQDWELIAVDDRSQDNTLEKLESWARRDGRIKVSRNSSNRGIGETRGTALDLASGNYAAILDADDIALPQWLDRLVAFLDSRPSVVLVSASRILIDESGGYIRRLHEAIEGPEVAWRLLFGNPINDPSSVFRRASVRAAGGYPPFRYTQDWELFSRLHEEGGIVQLGDALMKYRVHKQSSSYTVVGSRAVYEPFAQHVISDGVFRATGQIVPQGLSWYLFRNRSIFRGEPEEGRRALAFLHETCRIFCRRHRAGRHSGALAAAMIDDMANVQRVGCWSPVSVARSVLCVAQCTGVRSLLSLRCLASIAKLVLVPVSLRLIHSRQQS